ncbi:MAG: tyrosine-type recombinase/integrase [Janthinobacterium lividum]
MAKTNKLQTSATEANPARQNLAGRLPEAGDADSDNGMLVSASSDSAIASAFLLHANLAASTLKSTRTELGRFLLWCAAGGKTLAAIRLEDLAAYKAWLRDPQPHQRWVSATRWPRADPRWRPFSGPLSEASARQAFRVVKALLSFAANAGYLQRNAGSLVKNIKTRRAARISRYLPEDAIACLQAVLERDKAALDPGAANAWQQAQPRRNVGTDRALVRDRFLFLAFIMTGARLSEISSARMSALYQETDGRWWLDVMGKGSKPRRLPVPQEMLDAWRAYRLAYGLDAVSTRDEATPLALATRGSGLHGISDEAVANAMKALFARAAVLATSRHQADACSVLRQASVHWLRHTMLTVQANNDVALKTLQETAGHENISTTAMYLHKSDRQRHDEILDSFRRSGTRGTTP